MEFSKPAKSIESVPAFRRHLERSGLANLAAWDRRNKENAATDAAEILASARRAELRAKYGAPK